MIKICLIVHLLGCLAFVHGLDSICNGENFSPSCDNNKVLKVTQATYGRMRLGECVTIDLGYLGCSADVLSYVRAACSGRRACNFQVIAQNFDNIEPCSELRSYLEVSYECIEVATASTPYCHNNKYELLSDPDHYLSNLIARDTGCGSLDTPWRIEASSGQQIHISLINFTPEKNIGSRRCHALGYVSDVTQKLNITICSGTSTEASVYVTLGHIAEIQLLSPMKEESFLIRYQVLGCPDLPITDFMWYKRDGDTATVGCKASQVSWELECLDGHWNGVIGNCTDEGIVTEEVEKSGWFSIDNTYSIALIVCVSLGVALVVIVIVCIYVLCQRFAQSRKHRHLQAAAINRHKYHTPVSDMSFQTQSTDTMRTFSPFMPYSQHGSILHHPHNNNINSSTPIPDPAHGTNTLPYSHSTPLQEPRIWQRPLPDPHTPQTLRSLSSPLGAFMEEDETLGIEEEGEEERPLNQHSEETSVDEAYGSGDAPKYYILDKDYMDKQTLQVR